MLGRLITFCGEVSMAGGMLVALIIPTLTLALFFKAGLSSLMTEENALHVGSMIGTIWAMCTIFAWVNRTKYNG